MKSSLVFSLFVLLIVSLIHCSDAFRSSVWRDETCSYYAPVPYPSFIVPKDQSTQSSSCSALPRSPILVNHTCGPYMSNFWRQITLTVINSTSSCDSTNQATTLYTLTAMSHIDSIGACQPAESLKLVSNGKYIDLKAWVRFDCDAENSSHHTKASWTFVVVLVGILSSLFAL